MNKSNNQIIFGKPIAILVDGAFFFKRYRRCFPNGHTHSAEQVAKNMYTMLLKHVENEELYRIFFYDCPPLSKKAHNPISKRAIDFSKTDIALFRKDFHFALARQRKVALRLGVLKDSGNRWKIHPEKLKALLDGAITRNDITEDDVFYDVIQKGVDIRIGLDIASLAYKRLVSRIILVSGDSDFVPAAKLARREGIDFILDPMWQHVDPSLFLHIDGMRSTCARPKPKRYQKIL